MPPDTRYTQSGDVSIAYQVFGAGEHDLVMVPGYATHIDLDWDSPAWVHFSEALGSFTRVLHFDKRGTGLSDRLAAMPTLEERMDDMRAVMDAAGSERAVLFGISEGAPMCLLFAATYPERTESLVLYGGMARSTWAPDYPWATPAEDLIQSATEMILPYIYTGEDVEVWMPSYADDPEIMSWVGRYRRAAVSPAGLTMLFEMFLDIDVRHVLPTIRVPTLVMHRHGDRVVNWRAGHWMASQIAGARYVELLGRDHFPWVGDIEPIIGEIRQFVTGERGPAVVTDRVLATVMFTDIVGSTERAAALGDAAWRSLLEQYQTAVSREIAHFRGVEVKSMGDGTLATFDGPGRAIQCATAIRRVAHELGLRVRCGLHCGEVEVMGQDVGGIAVHLAARVGSAAQPDEVLVTSTVKDLVAGSGIEFEDRGTPVLKDIPEPWRCFVVH